MESSFKLDVKIFACQKLIACNRLDVVMGGGFWRDGNWEVAKPMAITWLKMENACILYNVIEFFWQRKVIEIERWKPLNPFKLQMALA